MKSPNQNDVEEVKRVGKFGLVGILNTLLDFVIFNVLGHFAHLSAVPANLISTTCAMTFSFFANKEMVFKRTGGSMLKQGLIFYTVTAFGLYVLQTGTIHILTDVWTYPTMLAADVSHILGLNQWSGDTFIVKNTAKAAGTVLSLVWNYLMYKLVVFRP
ncbi:GtrA family protein [bacterium]|nr:MAG: GtrA family protein [bacterium]